MKVTGTDFGRDIIPALQQEGRLLGYNFSQHNVVPGYIWDSQKKTEVLTPQTHDSNYWEDAGTIAVYHHTQMDLVGITPRFNIYPPIDFHHFSKSSTYWPLRASLHQYGPMKITREAMPRDCILSEGIILSAAHTSRCVFSPRVRVEDSTLENCVIFEGAEILNSRLSNVIVDKNARLDGVEIGHGKTPDPTIYLDKSGIHVVPRNFGRPDFNRALYTKT